MYMILTYDIKDASRLNKVHKICGKYLFWVQNSVFEGEIKESNIVKLSNEIKKVINKKEGDSVITWRFFSAEKFKRKIIGAERNEPTTEIW